MGRLDTLQGSGMFTRMPAPGDEPATPVPSFRRGGTAATPPAEEAPAQPVRRNAYAGNCTACGGRVEVQEGLLGDKVDGRWTVTHDGPCPPPLVDPDTLMKPDKGQGEPGEADGGPRRTTDEVHPGIYTLDKAEGHRTFRVVLQRPDADFAPGATILEFLCGPDNDHDYKGFAFVRGGRLRVWNRYRSGHNDLLADAEDFLRDPEAALQAKHCLRCGATLSTAESILRGLGPECYRKGI